MLFHESFWAGLADGSITVTFRRWRRPQVVAGRDYRSPAGMLHVDSISTVDTDTIDDHDARRAGFSDVSALRAYMAGAADRAGLVYRIEFHLAGPDPRTSLAQDDALDATAIAEIDRRLARYDKASTHGPWTRATLRLIAANPARRAADLARELGRETQPFKIDVRKLKGLGLTTSLDVGYRLSPRGEAYLAALGHT